MDERDTLETQRLILRPARLMDRAALQRLFPRWKNARYMSAVPWPYPPNGALIFLRETLALMRAGKDWLWAITLKGDDTMIGEVHLRKDKDSRGFWIAPEFQNRGFITEAVMAVNEFAFTRAGFEKLVIENAKPNRASSRIKEKTGGRLIGRTRKKYVIGMRPTEVWELTKADWEA